MKPRNACVLTVVSACVAIAASAQAGYVDAVLADNPFLYHRLNETAVANGTVAVNSSPIAGRPNGTYEIPAGESFGDPASFAGLSPGKQFNNSTTHINVPAQGAAYAALPGFTFEFLLKPADYDAGIKVIYSPIWWYDETSGFINGGTQLSMDGSNLSLYMIPDAHGTVVDISGAAAIGQWSHVAVTYQVSGADALAKFYVNGTLLNPGGTSVGNNQPGNFNPTISGYGNMIGLWGWTYGRHYNGGLDEFAIYDTALGDGTIANHYAQLVPEPGAVALLATGFGLLAYARRKRT